MRKIFYIMGKSGSGKDTIYNEILKNEQIKKLKMKEIILHTTRPMRKGESNGKEYFFISDEEFNNLEKLGNFIEIRKYNTANGVWKYGTSKNVINEENFIGIGTLNSYSKLQEYYGNCLIPIYISVEEEVLYKRAIERANGDNNQNVAEIRRRFEADKLDFSEDNLKKNKINKRFNNENLKNCVDEIVEYILKNIE